MSYQGDADKDLLKVLDRFVVVRLERIPDLHDAFLDGNEVKFFQMRKAHIFKPLFRSEDILVIVIPRNIRNTNPYLVSGSIISQ